jgi:hypothetical protein
VLLIESKETVIGRMNQEKNIPEYVIDSMMKSFTFPDYEEFDVIEVLQ